VLVVIVTIRSEDLPATEGLAWWCEQLARDIAPDVVSDPRAGGGRVAVTVKDLGPVQLSVLAYPEGRAVRSAAPARRYAPERCGLTLITANDVAFVQRDRGRLLMLHLPESVQPLRADRLDRLLAHRSRGNSGMNAILAGYLDSVATAIEERTVGENESERLGRVALDLAVATLAAQIDAQDRPAPGTGRQALLSRIDSFIELNLREPELTPATIAAHHHISLGYLHRLFQPRERTVAAWIRHRRLEHARAELADPRLRHHPVHVVAARWGFPHPAEFTRAFRLAHGLPPSDYRRRALATDGPGDAAGITVPGHPASRKW
jgi:AraC-like DNA-binding protein